MAPPRKEFRAGHGTARLNAERAAERARAGQQQGQPEREHAPVGVPQPKPEGAECWHSMAKAWWKALGQSDLALVAQPADWAAGWIAADLLDQMYEFGFTAGLFKEWADIAFRLHTPRFDLLEAKPADTAEPADPDEQEAEAAVADIRARFKVVGDDE